MWPLITGPSVVTSPAGRVNIADDAAVDVRLAPTNAVAEYAVQADGSIRIYTGSGGYRYPAGQWRLAGAAADYEVIFTPVTGDPPNVGSALNVWHGCDENPYIRLLNSDDFESEKSGTVFVQLRDAVTLAILDSATITLTANTFTTS